MCSFYLKLQDPNKKLKKKKKREKDRRQIGVSPPPRPMPNIQMSGVRSTIWMSDPVFISSGHQDWRGREREHKPLCLLFLEVLFLFKQMTSSCSWPPVCSFPSLWSVLLCFRNYWMMNQWTNSSYLLNFYRIHSTVEIWERREFWLARVYIFRIWRSKHQMTQEHDNIIYLWMQNSVI